MIFTVTFTHNLLPLLAFESIWLCYASQPNNSHCLIVLWLLIPMQQTLLILGNKWYNYCHHIMMILFLNCTCLVNYCACLVNFCSCFNIYSAHNYTKENILTVILPYTLIFLRVRFLRILRIFVWPWNFYSWKFWSFRDAS